MDDTVFSIAIFIAVSVSILVAIFLPLLMLSERCRAAEEKAHARRLTDARMNARLLRFNL
jgi:hypothetical protein